MPDEKKQSVQSKDFRVVFANGFRLRLGDNDTAITFLVETDNPEGKMYHLDEVQVCMTPKSMKLLNTILTVGLAQLEKAIGSIVLPDEKLAQIQKNLKVVKAIRDEPPA